MITKLLVTNLLFPLLLSACASSPETHYYMLQAQHPVGLQLNGNLPARSEGRTLQLRNVDIPEYLSRLQIVTRSDNGGLKIDDYNQWAEPLDSTFRRVLVENLSGQLTSWQIYDSANPNTNDEAEYNLDIQVFNFEKKSNKTLYFKALATITNRNKQTLFRRVEELNYPASLPEQDYNALVNAMNQCLANFAGKLSVYLQTIGKGNA